MHPRTPHEVSHDIHDTIPLPAQQHVQQTVALVREPYAAMLAEYTRETMHKQHTGKLDEIQDVGHFEEIIRNMADVWARSIGMQFECVREHKGTSA